MIYIVDFGSQTTHLISRRIKELGVSVKIISPEDAILEIENERPQGIILSGGPASVYEENAPTIDKKIFDLGIPILGICYGLQLTAHLLGGKVVSGRKQYGPVKLRIKNYELGITKNLPEEFTVWMSHGDEIITLPNGFEIVGNTEHMPFAFVENKKLKIVGFQFHPEVEHTENGIKILSNFLTFCKEKVSKQEVDLEEIIQDIKEKVGEHYVVGAVSGGVDSAVAGVLTARAIGKQFIPVYVNNGLMRQGTEEHVKKIFTHIGHVKPIVIDAVGETLGKLRGIADSEEKRKIIGNLYIEIFDREMEKLIKSGKSVKFLLQGTIYSDRIESGLTPHSSKIKSHHNVGGLPKKKKITGY